MYTSFQTFPFMKLYGGISFADPSNPCGESAIHLIIDPVTKAFNGHAVVEMKSADQAHWVMSDLNDMLFAVSTGPRPLQASVAIAGSFLALLSQPWLML